MSKNTQKLPPLGKPGGGKGRFSQISKPRNLKATLSRLWKYLKNYKLKLITVTLLVLFSTFANLFITRMIGVAISDYILPGNFPGLIRLIIILFVLSIGMALTTWIQIQLSINIGQNTVFQIRNDLFDKIQTLPIKYFDNNAHGDLMSRVTNDIDQIGNALNVSLFQAISSGLTIIGTLLFMIILSPYLTLINLITIPLLFIITKFVTKHSKKYFKEQQSALGELNGKIEEIISAQKVVKIFSKEDSLVDDFDKTNSELKNIGTKAQIFAGVIGPANTLVNNIAYTLVACIGGVMAILGSIDLGTITSFLIYSKHFSRPFGEIANQYNAVLAAIAGAERVFEVIDSTPEPLDDEDAYILENVKGYVELKNVYFEYTENHPILKNINLTATPGETIALVGPTGAGKTTIINLLTRFYDIQDGEIYIDNHNIVHVTRDSLRKTLGIVLQDTYLFSGTIKDNIRYGNLDASDNDIKNAAILANAHEFIRRLPYGYDTVLSENASSLSQGQKQMISIARAILADPAILILDEATSTVDTRTELKIQQAMLNLMKGRTSFVIAHRLSTIKNADKIVVINNGEIAEQGTHKELIAKKDFYFKLYMSQFS